MDDYTYHELLAYHQAQDDKWMDYQVFPYPDGACVLAAYTQEVGGLTGQDRIQYSKRDNSNIIKVELEGKYLWGKVLNILELIESLEPVVMVRWLEKVDDPALDQIFEQLEMV
ncbi:hypothetical protein CROQUDRAFT_677364 [Cronartium quercuum f. sp. fusiforme G11]|uniref:Uncharacterized protein n=1 Tax=Cronartium quercuum f. sp. fusiforme G11 TaxID=708437 RepID=A0A9P6NHF4_9BASI|nr:hypothetical protein CROQUDRAFT_677364 [Cronartium quercuum f. sp. fusiforme G11]